MARMAPVAGSSDAGPDLLASKLDHLIVAPHDETNVGPTGAKLIGRSFVIPDRVKDIF